jgi:hypothetical protein
MSGQPGPLGIACDAPPYGIVRACRQAGFRSPLDVRWCRMSRLLKEQADRERATWRSLWMAVLGIDQPGEPTCPCGEELPALRRFEFRRLGETVGTLLLGQCRRCDTMFWEEQPPRRSGDQ